MADSKTLLVEDKFYHIYNHAVGNEYLYINSANYLYFLELFKKYLISYVDIYAYCLMPNHFHLVIKIKSEKDILAAYFEKSPTRVSNPRRANDTVSLLISRQFSNLFNSYAQAFNKQNNRKGSLFLNRLKRKPIDTTEYLIKLIHYIHYNPMLANLCSEISYWNFSSYNAIVNDSFTLVNRKSVLELFGGRDNFIYCHKIEPQISGIE